MSSDKPPFPQWLQEHVFSPTELEDYQLCPYRFYASAYLGLKAANPLEVELTPLEIGSLVHRLLEQFFKKNVLNLDQEFATLQTERPHLSQPLLALQKKRIERMMISFVDDLERERAQASDWKPRYFEWTFGRGTPPLLLKDSDGRPASFRGRVDRIDVNETEKRFLIIDYKTGSTKISGNRIKAGEALQLPLYLLATQELLLKGYEPAGAVYYHLSDMSKQDGLLHAERLPAFLDVGPRSSSLVASSKWKATLETIQTKVGEIVSAIRKTPEEGFLSHSEPCEPFCPYQDICRMRSQCVS
jgi:ATP-dependent helicase/nuclease subunit B